MYLLAFPFLLVLVGGWLFLDKYSDPQTYSYEELVNHYYAPLVPMKIGAVTVQASVAVTQFERQHGLSDTPWLPPDIVKLFIFDESDQWGIWMKDMQYLIDILWVDDEGVIVHIEQSVHPNTFPRVFRPDRPALYVIETVAGFTDQHDITTGTSVVLPSV